MIVAGCACDVQFWVAARQCDSCGGFRGRTNKLVDSCYSFWCGGVFAILDKLKFQPFSLPAHKQQVCSGYKEQDLPKPPSADVAAGNSSAGQWFDPVALQASARVFYIQMDIIPKSGGILNTD